MFDKQSTIEPAKALPGRSTRMPVPDTHYVNGHVMPGADGMGINVPGDMQCAMFGMGCFWGAEKKFWELEGVYLTAVGYAAGYTPNPAYEEVCSGRTGHNEVVQVVFDPAKVSYGELLRVFWESHNPTQGMRQGNDRGTQYRSGVYTYNRQQMAEALASRQHYQQVLQQQGFPEITTEIIEAPEFYFAEDYHQQYLAKNPAGYCGLGGTGVAY